MTSPLSGVNALLHAYEAVVEMSYDTLDRVESGELTPESAQTTLRIFGPAFHHVESFLSTKERERGEALLARLNRHAQP